MKKIEKFLQSNLNKIDDNFKDEGKKENYEDYRETATLIIDLANDQGIELDISSTIVDELDKEDEELLKIEQEEFKNNFNKMKKFNKKFSKMYDKLLADLDTGIRFKKFNTKMVQEESLKLVDTFFKDYDKDIHDYYVNLVTGNNLFFTKHILDYLNGLTIDAIDNIDSSIYIVKRYSILDAIVIAHETIHSYLSDKLRYMKREEKVRYITNNIFEVYSHFIELVFRKYLESINFKQSDLNRLRDEYNGSMIDDLASLNTLLYYSKFNFKSECDVDTFNENQGYSYGKVLAYFFFSQYQNDKESAKNNILNFMLDAKEYDLTHLLNNYGLSSDELTDHKKLTKCIKLS